MNQCNWGTRDNVYVPQKRRKVNLDENDIKELEKQLSDAKANNELINKIEELLEHGASNSNDELLLQILAALERLEMKETIDKQFEKGVDVEKLIENQYNNNGGGGLSAQLGNALLSLKGGGDQNDENANNYWLTQEECLRFSDYQELHDNEITFWKKLIRKYLSVDKLEPSDKHKLQVGLNDMRDRGVFAFFMLNALWIAFVFPILLAQDRLKDMLYIPIPIPSLYYQPVLIEPLGVLHLAFFAFISLVQFLAMLCHRYNTFQHILASTKLRSNIHEGMRIEDIIDTVKMLQQIKPIDEEAEPMPDYSDEEIDKASDMSESDEVLIDGKPVKIKDADLKSKDEGYLRNRLGKHGHDNPAFIDDTNLNNSKIQKDGGNRSKSEDRIMDSGAMSSAHQHRMDLHVQKRNRRSRRLQKKNSLDVQFRRRFSMLRDGNAGVNNNIYNESEAGFNGGLVDLDATGTGMGGMGGGRESRTSSMLPPGMGGQMPPPVGLRASSGNLSTRLLDKRFNKMLFNMHGIPVSGNITSQKNKNQQQLDNAAKMKGNRKRKPLQIEEQHV